MSAPDAKTARIREQNDAFRRNPVAGIIAGRCIMTAGIAAMTPHVQLEIFRRVQTFDEFTEAGDPHGEHDFGAFDHPAAGKIFWKIDYYDPTCTKGSEDPADPKLTCRVLTIMLATEY